MYPNADKPEIPNFKEQIPNKSQIANDNDLNNSQFSALPVF